MANFISKDLILEFWKYVGKFVLCCVLNLLLWYPWREGTHVTADCSRTLKKEVKDNGLMAH